MSYEQNRVRLATSLHKVNDAKRIEFCKSVDFSNWVKQQIDIAIAERGLKCNTKQK